MIDEDILYSNREASVSKMGLSHCYVTGTYLMASHMSRPIFTQFLAWFGRDSGRPDTQ